MNIKRLLKRLPVICNQYINYIIILIVSIIQYKRYKHNLIQAGSKLDYSTLNSRVSKAKQSKTEMRNSRSTPILTRRSLTFPWSDYNTNERQYQSKDSDESDNGYDQDRPTQSLAVPTRPLFYQDHSADSSSLSDEFSEDQHHHQLQRHNHNRKSIAKRKGKSSRPRSSSMSKSKEKKQKRQVLKVIINVLAIVWLYIFFYLLIMYTNESNQILPHLTNFIQSKTRINSHNLPSSLRGNNVNLPYSQPSSPIDYPTPNTPPTIHKVSVVLINHSHPRMIQESSLLRTLVSHPQIDEIILLHANPLTSFQFLHPKVINIDATNEHEDMGLGIRFYYCQLSQHPWVMHLDDSIEVSEEAITALLEEFGKDSQRIVGRYGWNRLGGGGDAHSNSWWNRIRSRIGWSSKSAHKESDVISTKFMVMERDVCTSFFEYAHLIWEDIVLDMGIGPLWNGEDIFMSLVANHVYTSTKQNPSDPSVSSQQQQQQRTHYAMDWLDIRNASSDLKDYSSNFSNSGNARLDLSGALEGVRPFNYKWWLSLMQRNQHDFYRDMLWKATQERLSSLGPYNRDGNLLQ